MLDPYGAGAQYYDLLHGKERAAQAREIIKPLAGWVRHGVLDLGAGTGIAVVEAAALIPRVPITVVEPSRAMRTVLFNKLAADSKLRSRTTVLPHTAEQLELDGVADLAICLDTSPSFPPPYRPDIWEKLHRALVPGGALVLDLPELGEPVVVPGTEVGRVEIGQTTLVGYCRGEPAGQRQWWEFRYTLQDADGELIADDSVEHYTWPVEPRELQHEVEAVGFVAKDTRDVAGSRILVLRRQ
jgi:SAM-dependent methyltransferase